MDFLVPNVSIIITSYNQSSSLRVLLLSLSKQTHQRFEILIADDGSSDSSFQLCEEMNAGILCSALKNKIKWITQKDEGYRKSKILNQASRYACSDYCVFLDADVLLEKHFIEDHLKLRKPDSFVCGRRVHLGPWLTSHLSAKEIESQYFPLWNLKFLWSSLKKDTQDWKRGYRISSPLLRKLLRYDRPIDLLGSNFSLWRKDLESVNGFNESLESYWGEDGDLFIRLRNLGKKAIGAKSLCIQYHLFHERRTPTEATFVKYQEELKKTDYVWAEKGLKR